MKKFTLYGGMVCVLISYMAVQSASLAKDPLERSATDRQLLEWARDGKIDEIKDLLSSGKKVDLRRADTCANTALHWAARNGHKSVVKALLAYAKKNHVCGNVYQEGVAPEEDTDASLTRKYVNFRNVHSMTALHEALLGGHTKVMRLLIKSGASCIINAVHNDEYEGAECNGRPLHAAVQGGSLDCVKLILKKDMDVHFKDALGRTPLHYAAMRGDVEIYAYLVENDAYEDERDNDKYTPPHYAALYGKTKLIRWLLDKRQDVNKKDGKGRTLLHCAVEKGHRKTATRLLQGDAEINAVDSDYKTPLYYAFKSGDCVLAKALFEKNAEMYAEKPNYFNEVRAIPEAKDRMENLVISVLEEEDLVLRNDSKRWKALMHAVDQQDDVSIKLLVESANVRPRLDVTESYKLDVLHDQLNGHLINAIQSENCSLMELMLESGANISRVDSHKKTPLSYALEGGNDKVIKILLKKGSPLTRQPNLFELLDGKHQDRKDEFMRELQRELGRAVENKNCTPEMVDLLIREGADLRKKDYEKLTALHRVAISGTAEIAQYLIGKKARLEATCSIEESGSGASSVRSSTSSTVHVVEKCGGYTPLLVAAAFKNSEVVKVLLKAGANLLARDDKGRTALTHAKEAGDDDLEQFLIAEGATE